MPRVDADVTGFPFIEIGEEGGEDHYNAAIRQLDMVVQASVLDKDLVLPPDSPADGDCYFLNGIPSAEWVGQQGKLAQWFADLSEWVFADVPPGYLVYVQDENGYYHVNNAGTFTSGPT